MSQHKYVASHPFLLLLFLVVGVPCFFQFQIVYIYIYLQSCETIMDLSVEPTGTALNFASTSAVTAAVSATDFIGFSSDSFSWTVSVLFKMNSGSNGNVSSYKKSVLDLTYQTPLPPLSPLRFSVSPGPSEIFGVLGNDSTFSTSLFFSSEQLVWQYSINYSH